MFTPTQPPQTKDNRHPADFDILILNSMMRIQAHSRIGAIGNIVAYILFFLTARCDVDQISFHDLILIPHTKSRVFTLLSSLQKCFDSSFA